MSSTKRTGMTLIEILVVIAIIGVLASLLLGGVMMVRARIPEATTRNDILQLGTGLTKFYGHKGHNFYPPSRLRLCSNRSTYGTSTLDKQSISAITKMFPNINWTNIPWDGSTTTLDFTLEGDQCLVFFLGGIPNGAGKPPLGFSTNATNPAASGGDRIKFFDFEAGRIVIRSGSFPSYQDGYRKLPYVYFSSMSEAFRENGYDTAGIPMGLGVSPYIQQVGPPAKYWKSTEYQIISAGNDGVFGPGGAWPNTSAGTRDDMSNFHDRMLGSP